MRLLQRLQTSVADRWYFVPHPRLYRAPKRAEGWVDRVFKWGVFGTLMWIIWAPVLLVMLIGIMALVG